MNSVDVDLLKYKYVVEKKAMNVIAEEMGVSVWNVHDKLHKAGVSIRPQMTPQCQEAARKANTGRKQSKEEREMRSAIMKQGGVGGKKRLNTGYMAIYFPDHPQSKDGYILEHRLVMEGIIGRHLQNGECVHHINGIKDDNRKENLMIMTDKEHKRLHMKERYKSNE